MLRPLVLTALLLCLLVVGVPLFFAGFGQAPPRVGAPPATVGDVTIRLYRQDLDTLQAMPLEEYVLGVVAAEMPAAFHPEALRAQAVVARTYAVRRMRVFGGPGCDRHPQADVCADPTTGQAYASQEELRARWGFLRYEVTLRPIRQAVESTRGEILVHDGRPIDAVYHSTSGGHTEDAAAVWGQEIPYLRGVPSPYEDHSPRLEQRVFFTLAELAARLDIPAGDLRTAAAVGEPVIEVLAQGTSGRARSLRVAGHLLDAREFRSRLELNSTWFSWELGDGGVTLQVRGFGHGVGLSQYGADGLARQGVDYREILLHYYPGVTLRPLFVE